MSEHPYRSAPKRAFWSKAVAKGFAPGDLLAPGTILLRLEDRVMSAGSCFAANLVPYLEGAGFTYLRTERRPAALRVPPENLSYDKFTAAYGNLYTIRQLLQLLRRSQGTWEPEEDMWEEAADRIVDPYRPGMRYAARSVEEFRALTHQHLACVDQAFRGATVLVFTLGLTEAWVSSRDGAVFPGCPGTVAGSFDADYHRLHNFGVAEVTADLDTFITEVRRINPGLRIILTVSPVPLVATATGGHVLAATTYSKSVLRVAAGMAEEAHDDVSYFPSYEIVTGPQAPHDFFEADRRDVSEAAVRTIMETFLSRCDMAGTATASVSDLVNLNASAASLAGAMAHFECEEAMADSVACHVELSSVGVRL